MSAPTPYERAARQAATPQKQRRIFRWVFLVIQAIFLAWLIGGIVSASNSTHCGTDQLCQTGKGIGTGIGAALIIGLWVAVDVILGIGYLIFRKR